MNNTVFETVVTALANSTGEMTFTQLAQKTGKGYRSVSGEIGRLKKTSWIKDWLRVDFKNDKVTLTASLRGIKPEMLIWMVKQFYNHDKLHSKGLFDPNVSNTNSFVEMGVQDPKVFVKKVCDDLDEQHKLIDFSDIDMNKIDEDIKKERISQGKEPNGSTKVIKTETVSFEDFDFDSLGIGNKPPASVTEGGR